jgi:hypothetical protein
MKKSLLSLSILALLAPAFAAPGFFNPRMAEGEVGGDPLDMMDDILDRSIDDLADLPEFKIPPTGMYKFEVSAAGKMINDKPAIEINVTIKETIELADAETPASELAKEGDKFSIAFFMRNKDGTTNEFAEGRLKAFAAPFQQHFGESNIKTLLKAHLKSSVLVTGKITKKARKDDKEKFDGQISDIVVE